MRKISPEGIGGGVRVDDRAVEGRHQLLLAGLHVKSLARNNRAFARGVRHVLPREGDRRNELLHIALECPASQLHNRLLQLVKHQTVAGPEDTELVEDRAASETRT